MSDRKSGRRRAARTQSSRAASELLAAAPVTPPAGALPGTIVRAYGKFFDVQLRDDDRVLLSTVRGIVRREKRRSDLVAVGDRVWVTDVGEGEGQIELIEPRGRVLARRARMTEDTEQIILANLDQALFLFAVREPVPHRRMLDRFLVMAESRQLPAMVGVGKLDLDQPVGPDDATMLSRQIFGDYAAIYPVFYLSTATGEGIAELRAALLGKVTAIAGPSGVGKSTLLNRLDPARVQATAEVSTATGKGRHTTTATELWPLRDAPAGTFVADTPGIRALALHGVAPDDLPECFPEFRAFLGQCFYPDCTHLHEPGCAVIAAVEAGAIAPARYESYGALRRGDDDYY